MRFSATIFYFNCLFFSYLIFFSTLFVFQKIYGNWSIKFFLKFLRFIFYPFSVKFLKIDECCQLRNLILGTISAIAATTCFCRKKLRFLESLSTVSSKFWPFFRINLNIPKIYSIKSVTKSSIEKKNWLR